MKFGIVVVFGVDIILCFLSLKKCEEDPGDIRCRVYPLELFHLMIEFFLGIIELCLCSNYSSVGILLMFLHLSDYTILTKTT